MVGICRLCAGLRKLDALTTITDTNHMVCRKLRECCRIEISLDDTLPKCICYDCLEALQQAHSFYVKVHESQESLATLFPPEKRVTGKKLNTAKSPTLAESLASAINSKAKSLKETEVIIDCDDVYKNLKREVEITVEEEQMVEVEEQTLENNEELEAPTVSNEDEVNLMLERDEEIDDEVYLIDKILGRKFDEENLSPEVAISVKGETSNSKELKQNTCTRDEPRKMLTRSKRLVVEELPKKEPYQRVNNVRQETQQIKGVEEHEEEEEEEEGEEEEEEEEEEFLLEIMAEENEVRDESQLVPDHDDDQEQVELQDLDEEQQGNWNTYTWLCSLCTAQESSFIDLLMHCHVAHERHLGNDSQFKCVDCQKICPRYYSFVNHVRFRHRSQLKLCCDVCNMLCSNFKQLASHRKEEHAHNKNFPPMILCEVCGHGFKDQNCLQMHLKIHQKSAKNFECNLCGKSFGRFVSWEAHQKVHSDIKEFSCEQCGKSFRQKINLDTHILTHVSEKPYQCSKCQKAFKTPCSLEKHLQTHSAIKKFKCDYCENTFRTKDSKLSHERTHTGERPYKCSFCDRSYRFRSTFIAHQHMHTGNRPYSCEPCNHHFTNWSNYNKHMKRRHANTLNATDETKKRRRNAKDNKKPDSNSYILYEVLDDVAMSTDSAVHPEEVTYSVSTENDGDDNTVEITQVTDSTAPKSQGEKKDK